MGIYHIYLLYIKYMEDSISFIYNLDSRQAPDSVPIDSLFFLFGSPVTETCRSVRSSKPPQNVTVTYDTEMSLHAYCCFHCTELCLRAYCCFHSVSVIPLRNYGDLSSIGSSPLGCQIRNAVRLAARSILYADC